MSENLLQTLQHLVQDVIAPDVRELKVRVASLEKQMDTRFESVDSRFDALEIQMSARFEAIEWRLKSQDSVAEARFEALLSAISESKSHAALAAFRAVAPVSERVAVLEAQRQ